MPELTRDGDAWNYFLCAQEMAKLHSLFRDLTMPLFTRDHMVQTTFSQKFVTTLEVAAGDDVKISDLSVSSIFLLVGVL